MPNRLNLLRFYMVTRVFLKCSNPCNLERRALLVFNDLSARRTLDQPDPASARAD